MEKSKSRRCADSNDMTKEVKRARVVKMRKALRDWKIEKSRIKANNNARRDRKKMEAERGLIAC